MLKHSSNVHVFKIQYNTLVSQGNRTEENVFEKRKVFKEDLKDVTEVARRTETVVWFQEGGAW